MAQSFEVRLRDLAVYFVLVSMTLVSCGNKKVETTYPSGKIMETFELDKKEMKQGKYVMYNEDGTIHEEANYKDDKLVGQRHLYHPNGKLEIEEIYNDAGELDGMYKLYYPTGEINLEKKYEKNMITGNIKVYYPNGKLKEDVSMKDNQENGPFVEYYSNGQVHWEGTYLNGDNEFGLLIEYDSLGGIIKKMNCDSLAICRTFWKPGMPEIPSQK